MQLRADVTPTTIIGNNTIVHIIVFCQCELFSSRAVQKYCLKQKWSKVKILIHYFILIRLPAPHPENINRIEILTNGFWQMTKVRLPIRTSWVNWRFFAIQDIEGDIQQSCIFTCFCFLLFFFFLFNNILPLLFLFIEDVGNMAVRVSSPLCGWHDLWQTLDGEVWGSLSCKQHTKVSSMLLTLSSISYSLSRYCVSVTRVCMQC